MSRPSRREFLQIAASGLTLGGQRISLAADAPIVPQSVADLWRDFDPRNDPLETEIIREWQESGAIYRHVRFLVGHFKGHPARMAAIYGVPLGTMKRPAVMHIHGGGQRASLQEVKLLVRRGYATLSVNWGGSGTGKPPINAPEGAQPNDPNTDWGAVDPSQLNVPGYHSLRPGPKQWNENQEHPKNNNWYLLTLGCRRGLTFLERQPEVDPDRLGVHGFSMGGNLTMYVAGSDDRVKAAVPAVGGSGWGWEAHRFTAGTITPMSIQGNLDTFRRTLSFESYAPWIRCPVLHRSSTNDFHGWMDDVYRTNATIRHAATRFSWAPHLNHRFTPEVAVTMPLWFDQHLKGGPALPETPPSTLVLKTAGGVPQFRVTPVAHRWPISQCEIFYSVDDDPRARFWRSAPARREGDSFLADLPLHQTNLPLFAFANVRYQLPEPIDLGPGTGFASPVREVCISSLLHAATPEQLTTAHVRATAQPTTLLDDFSAGFRDWYQLNAGNPTHWEAWTRKVTDPMFRGPPGARLQLTLEMPKTNRLTFLMMENEWRSYRGPRNQFLCEREIPGKIGPQTITLGMDDFRNPQGTLRSWNQIDQLGIAANSPKIGRAERRIIPWNGPAPTLLRLEWV
ncbi:alpha/beta hydrolase family protein [Tuwongella immobilis]|uniref:Dienelactone hydrolase domain-containing protein n=1 Tax=Tuwongella immobilis TaxID=692036 RepID=A0A6C2YX50_9BACT|nr:dienelactone hydrolase family protein [Tuwongella immobilis]VIP05469.1 secreted protein containing dienelactone hydrolase domain protein : Dipeptidylaminopeptidase/acylaminoacyl-peptidase-like protein OS=Pirellula staleyi (strain ATCC 27377 / DSM 6068 / ICPB 4128) GN=Psta_4426 PE=4 SV=1: Abhydrolase_5 [Tuwongella immobilis]VTS08294.1 secreted protein containing dienelactone hydrolase domain protein : Dipeptidylaminopeptidase/acylaminoacyl-peptidase-like protein OS=Pirellula staleyi (strain ATC